MRFARVSPVLLGMLFSGIFGLEVARGQGLTAPSADDPDVATLDARAKEFLEKIAADQAQQAFKDLLASNPLFDASKPSEAMTNLLGKASELKANYGECLEVERAVAKKVGTRLIVLRYLYHCERFPLVWHFVFYRPPLRRDAVVQPTSPWYLISVRFDTELERLIDTPATNK